MSVTLYHNLAAGSAAGNLQRHYQSLGSSIQRLSTGLRINSAADDASGLAIRELQRAEIAAYKQGVRNINDAISLIQTTDGALGIIDEKLIRMKELAEQAATGTYDSTQRLMIDSEFQAMGAEIDRIARSTEFNGIKLIDAQEGWIEEGDAEYDMTHSGSCHWLADAGGYTQVNVRLDPLNDDALGDWEIFIANDLTVWIDPADKGKEAACWHIKSADGAAIDAGTRFEFEISNGALTMAVDGEDAVIVDRGTSAYEFTAGGRSYQLKRLGGGGIYSFAKTEWTMPDHHAYSVTVNGKAAPHEITWDSNVFHIAIDLGDNVIYRNDMYASGSSPGAIGYYRAHVNVTKEGDSIYHEPEVEPVRIHFGPMNDAAEDYYDIEKRDATLKGLGLEGVEIKTQQASQEALVTISDAIVKKDGIRSYYGTMQNRLENTASAQSIMAENLQAAESRISDADVAREMMNFVRNQILTQSAVAMVAQANSMPQMVMRLIG